MRARAMSTLGGTFRFGLFIGPFVTAAILSCASIGAVYAFGALMSLAAAILTAFLPDVTLSTGGRTLPLVSPSLGGVGPVRAPPGPAHPRHRHPDHLGGAGHPAALVPLWADPGIDAATTSVIFGISAGLDLLLFYPGGAIMDRFGRVWVAVPSLIVLGAGFFAVAADAAPARHRSGRA